MSPAQQWFASLSPSEKESFLLRVLGPPREYVAAEDKEQVMTMLRLIGDPEIDCSSQRFVTHIYRMNNRCYHVTYFDNDEYEIEVRDDTRT